MKTVLTATAIAIAALALADPAYAQPQQAVGGIGTVASTITSNLAQIPTLLGTAFQAIGIWFAGSAAFKLKELGETGHDRETANKAITHGVAAVVLVALPLMMGVGM
ncbi:MAG: hypothetical protein ACK5X0_09615, partial [Rhodospirillales bacterium]